MEYWADQSKELKRLVKEWNYARLGILQAYKNGDISKRKYNSYKKQLGILLDEIERSSI